MTKYSIVRAKSRTFIFATDCDISSHVEVDTALLSPQEILEVLQTNAVAPEHLQNVYEDLLYTKNML